MNCPKCNKPNREKAVFCKWCGTNVVTKATEPLRELVGMETVKNQLQDLVNTCESLALRAQRSGISIRLGMDMIITGNTGTGKTKLAGVLQKLLYSSGIIKKPAMKVVDAVDYEEFAKEWEKNTADLKNIYCSRLYSRTIRYHFRVQPMISISLISCSAVWISGTMIR